MIPNYLRFTRGYLKSFTEHNKIFLNLRWLYTNVLTIFFTHQIIQFNKL